MKHREKMAEQHITPLSERVVVKGFNVLNATPLLWNMGVKVGATMASKIIKNGKMPLNVGAIGKWAETRDLPQPDGQSFRSWFETRDKK